MLIRIDRESSRGFLYNAPMPDTDAETATPTSTATRRCTATVITGAGGEVGHGLIRALAQQGRDDIVAVDLNELDGQLRRHCRDAHVGDICDDDLLDDLFDRYDVGEIYHLAALLSTSAEKHPEKAHAVNVGGTMALLSRAAVQAKRTDTPVRFLFPSTIAVYGLPTIDIKNSAPPIREDQYQTPITMYGCNKLYGEHLGRYFTHHYRQLTAPAGTACPIDFRGLRYPGIISADTVPTGGTSDFAPEMIHAAAQGKPYASFVDPDARIPFVTMPDAIDALVALAAADQEQLTQCVYNVGSFNPSAGEIAAIVREYFPKAEITFKRNGPRAAIVDTWPAAVDDTAARRDWGYAPKHDLDTAFADYIIPAVRARYAR